MYGFRGDGYSGYSLFVLDLQRPAEGLLDTSWSPVRPIYVFQLTHEAKYVLSDDLSVLSSLVEMLTVRRHVDELFGVWSLTGRAAGQFGTSLIRTPWSDIHQLPAGVRASFGDQISCTRRESPFWATDQLSAHRAADKIRFAFEASVASCVDGRAAILASGGIDSSAIVGVCRALNRDVVLMTNFYPDAPETDEMPYARLLERQFGYPLIALRGRRESLLAITSWPQARPFRGLFRSDDEEVIRCAKQRDVQVVVDGLGGDELFAVRDFPLGRLSNRVAARRLLGHRDWSAIYGRRDYCPNPPRLLPPFIEGVDELQLLWEFQFRPLVEMDCPRRLLKRIYALMFESSFWEEARWLSESVFGPNELARVHPYIDIELIHAVMSAPARAFRRSPVVKRYQRSTLAKYLPPVIADRRGSADQTANVMFNFRCSAPDLSDVIANSILGDNRFIDGDKLRTWYRTAMIPANVYPGGRVDFDQFWATICYELWLRSCGRGRAR
jgi:asparagine synthetase B (glutamine-hydrolysing)